MKKLLFYAVLLIIGIIIIAILKECGGNEKIPNKQIVQDFSLKTKEQLTTIYGKPVAENRWRVNDNDVEIYDPIENERNITFHGIDIFGPSLPMESGFTGGTVHDLGDGIYRLRFSGDTSDHLNVTYREKEKKLIVNIRNIN